MKILDGVRLTAKYLLRRFSKSDVTDENGNTVDTALQDLKKNGVHFPKTTLTHSGFGMGKEAWDRYRYTEVNAAQYMSPYMLTGDNGLRNSIHYNLCGELAVLAAAGFDIEEGIRQFALVSGGKNVLNNNATTNAYILAELLRRIRPGKYLIEYPRNSVALDTVEEIKGSIEKGNIIIALVNIDTTKQGNLRPMLESVRKVAHWVWLKGIFYEGDDTAVLVYNPFMNREELYPWNTFMGAYEKTYGNTSMYLSLHAINQEVW